MTEHTYPPYQDGEEGLIILSAVYGCLDGPGIKLDVTIPVQAYVNDGELVMHAGSKSRWDGFYDTDPTNRCVHACECVPQYVHAFWNLLGWFSKVCILFLS